MKKLFTKRALFDLVLWCVFGFCAYSAGARWSINPIASIGMYAIVLTMVLREYQTGLREGSEIASRIWKEQMDGLFQKLRNE